LKKFILGFIFGIALSLTAVAYASDTVETYLYQATFLFNDERKDPESEYVVLNYNGHAYLPIRFVAENLGAVIGYDDESRTISIKNKPLDITDPDRAPNSTLFKVGNLILIKEGENTKVIGQFDVGEYTGYVGINLSFYNSQGEKIGQVGIGGFYRTGIHPFEVIGEGDFRNYATVRMHVERP
jgi:hypothetical protein